MLISPSSMQRPDQTLIQRVFQAPALCCDLSIIVQVALVCQWRCYQPKSWSLLGKPAISPDAATSPTFPWGKQTTVFLYFYCTDNCISALLCISALFLYFSNVIKQSPDPYMASLPSHWMPLLVLASPEDADNCISVLLLHWHLYLCIILYFSNVPKQSPDPYLASLPSRWMGLLDLPSPGETDNCIYICISAMLSSKVLTITWPGCHANGDGAHWFPWRSGQLYFSVEQNHIC